MSSFPIDACYHNRAHRQMFNWNRDKKCLELEIDNSTVERFSCPRAYEIYHVLGYDVAKRDALNYGSAMHHALECYFKGGTLAQCQTVLAEFFADNPCEEGSWRNLDHAIEAIRNYITKREQFLGSHAHWTPLTLPSGKPAVEMSFREVFSANDVPLAVLDHYSTNLLIRNASEFLCDFDVSQDNNVHVPVYVYYTGKLDLAIEDPATGGYAIVDHKTSSVEGKMFWPAFDMSPQMRGYHWAATRKFGRPPSKVIIDVLFGRAHTAKGKGIPHETQFKDYNYRQDQIEEWEANLHQHLDTLFRYLSRGRFPEMNSQCIGKFGPCPYLDVCKMPPDTRQVMLASGMYTDRTWNPLAN